MMACDDRTAAGLFGYSCRRASCDEEEERRSELRTLRSIVAGRACAATELIVEYNDQYCGSFYLHLWRYAMQMKRRLTAAIIPLLGLPVAAAWSSAAATPTVITNLASWQSAVGQAAIQVEDFSQSPLGILPGGVSDVCAFSVFLDTGDAPDPIYHP